MGNLLMFVGNLFGFILYFIFFISPAIFKSLNLCRMF